MNYQFAWMQHQIRMGETVLTLREAGHGWREIAKQLRLGDGTDARRCLGLYLSATRASQSPEARDKD